MRFGSDPASIPRYERECVAQAAQIAALEAEVERLKHWLVASPAQMSVGGGRLLPIDSTGMRTLIDERAPFVALAKAANALLFNGIEAVETALAHPAVQRAVTG